MPGNRPNILFILSDQQRWDTLGCYGQKLDISPNLDRLASEGVRVSLAFTPQPVCGPARSCLQSGQYATRTGCTQNNRILPTGIPTVAGELAAAGYETSYVGKWHLASDPNHNCRTAPIPADLRGGYRDYWMAADTLEFTSHGYEGYFFDRDGQRIDWEGYRVDRTTDFAMDFLRDYATRRDRSEARQTKPFFLFLSYIEPHHQNDLDRYIGPMGSKQRFAEYEVPGDLVGTDGPGSAADWRRHYPDYLGCCWSIDQNIGRLRNTLTDIGLADHTLIIYTSDHGCHFCTRNKEYKRSCHDNSIRVPLITWGPGFRGGIVIDELVSLIDLPPTVLAAAGVEVPSTFDGLPIQRIVQSNSPDWPKQVFVQISESQNGRAVRTHRWKYGVTDADDVKIGSYRQRPHTADRYVEQYLYDLDADPHERTNLVAEGSLVEVRAELAATLKRCMTEAKEPDPMICAVGA